jgi:hypothetical protein
MALRAVVKFEPNWAHPLRIRLDHDVVRLVRVDDAKDSREDELLDDDGVALLDHHLERLADAVLASDSYEEVKVDRRMVDLHLLIIVFRDRYLYD